MTTNYQTIYCGDSPIGGPSDQHQWYIVYVCEKFIIMVVLFTMDEPILRHLVKSQLVECLRRKSVAHIPSPNLAPISSIDRSITGSNVSTICCYYYVLAK